MIERSWHNSKRTARKWLKEYKMENEIMKQGDFQHYDKQWFDQERGAILMGAAAVQPRCDTGDSFKDSLGVSSADRVDHVVF
jgi:hypothetical protein